MFKYLFVFLIPIISFSQITFSGKVIDARTKEPLSGTSIYIPNSSIGTTTDIDGDFSLQLSRETKEIVVSYLGYYTINVKLDLSDSSDFSKTILLREKSNTLNEVVVVKQKQDKDWHRRYKIFKTSFLGQSTLAQNAEILNEEELYFTEISDSTGYRLIANTNKPLLVLNKATGYLINYDLIEFNLINPKDQQGFTFYLGYSFFEDIVEKYKLKPKKVTKNRLEAYYGSLNHFLKSAHENKIKEEGFLISQYIIKDNPKYPDANTLKKMKEEAKKTGNYHFFKDLPKKEITIIGKALSKTDFVKDSEDRQFLDFENYVLITYTKASPDSKYMTDNFYQVSYLKVENEKVEVFSNGNYYNPLNLLVYGYMGWKKVGDLIPLDFNP
ncbi:carboxypeptidase-like regulatory domain-containing protein [Flavobacterium sp. NRK F10]|uniref:carboxypeptidase-like regulatory domain-containing protein n=1 Tax=Flavobacterium sp. NRK F10 TaxID=2954931 RepID=UPI002091D43A|nr:carboxypeptidase-like regulatory domain-containing protein [Flavobacterium sp. NRK F10]MCO6174308.1 carboxypeptidase-like regulatory domain-containing protein [Flavobacterium sp. NRK F10]